MPGGYLQLAAYGAQDLFLTGNPTLTYFVSVYKRHTPFAIESVRQLFTGNPNFGKKVHCRIHPIASLINRVFLEVKLPSLNPDQNNTDYISANEVRYSWINSIGHALVQQCEIEIGGNVIDRHYGQWLEIWSELTIPKSKQDGYYEMIGKHQVFDSTSQVGPLHLIIPLQFWFCRNIGLSLPLIALQQQEVRINVSFRDFDDLWISSTGDPADNLNSAHFSISEAVLYIDYIYLGDDEKRWFAQNPHNYLIDQLQINALTLDAVNLNNIIPLDGFNHPVKELIWVVQNSDVIAQIPEGGNEWFNFSDRESSAIEGPGGGNRPTDCMVDAVIQFEGEDRFTRREAKHFRLTQPYEYHTTIPNNFIYVYSFALEPESEKPTGSCNFSLIDNVTLNMNIIRGLEKPVITIYAVNFNILRIDQGMGAVMYSD